MSPRHLVVEILKDRATRKLLDGWVDHGYAMAVLLDFADTYLDLTADLGKEAKVLTDSCVSEMAYRVLRNNLVASQLIRDCIKKNTGVVKSLAVAVPVFEKMKADQADDAKEKAEKTAREQEEQAKEAARLEQERKDAEKRKREQEKADQEATIAAKLKEQKRLKKEADEEEARRKALEQNQDSENADSEPPITIDQKMSRAEYEALPIADAGFPDGIGNDLIKGGVETIGALLLYRQTRSLKGADGGISGIGDKSVPKIEERLAELEALVTEDSE